MYFSDLQSKLVLEKESGETLGYIEDAIIDTEKGVIQTLIVSKSSGLFQKSGETKSYPFASIHSIGSELVFVHRHWH